MSIPSVKNYTPRTDSLTGRVIAFFQRNPEEELGLEEIHDKFDATRGNIHTQLGQAVDAGLLLRDRNHDGDYIYRAGPAMGTPAPTPASMPGAPPAPKGYASPRHFLDLAALQVDEGVPCILFNGNRAQSKWEPLFAKLTKPTQSIAVPSHIKGALAAAANKRNKEKRGTFRVAMTGPGEARIWRVA